MARSVHLVRRPSGLPVAGDFAIVDGEPPSPRDGTALVENLYVSVDPYMRGLMDDTWPLGTAGEGRSIGRVVESRTDLRVGDLVFHWRGWRTHALVEPADVRVLRPADGVPLSAYLGILGGTGLTAYVGLTRVGRLRPGETVFVSAAAGGVGSAAGQIARTLGAGRVVGSAGSAAKVRHLLDDLGYDAAFDYHDGPVAELLAKAAPDGVDVYFDNVGGDQLEAALGSMRERGRLALCGAIARHSGDQPGPRNLFEIIRKNLRLEGFSVRDHLASQPELEEFLVPHLQSGAVVPAETIVEGIDNAVEAFRGLFRGDNTGKTIVRVGS
ncbi:NADP-dependent oxidoreductase [Fodinicola acaciae]|uniref:NADP-dependent oxidoreductase n=1 Tax=Fodinicola acaciae TaxID=2681555 RepID=UPI0013D3D237|nr:NADP-dependent oxidoreductase [Fodinicola acaciae]